ncbi:MAG: serine/threonine protein kinase [Anaerolineales bacterium]|nr:serine/threonine protein kinase [Anaerolineales bacterium]
MSSSACWVRGFGYVYLAHDRQGHAYAIKQCTDLSSEGLMQFGHEVAVQKILTDETFVRLYAQFVEQAPQPDTGAMAESLFTVMEYIPGRSLEELLDERLQRNQGPFSEQTVIPWMIQLLASLHHAHDVGVIHRDIKPGNILLMPGGNRIKVIDFGIAKIGGSGNQTLSGARGISPGYSPPEQYAQSGKTDRFSDLYAVGATLYHLLTGVSPVDAPVRQSGQLLIPPRQHNPSLSLLIEHVIVRSMQLDVADRFQSALEMQAALLGQSGPPVSRTTLIPAVALTAAAPPSIPVQQGTQHLVVTPKQLDWGKVTYRQPPIRQLNIENSGGGTLQVNLHSPVRWLQIRPASLTVGPNERRQVAVELFPTLMDARGQHRETIHVTMGGASTVQLQVIVNQTGPVALSAAPRTRLETIPQLVNWCDRHWQDAIRMLRSGELLAAIEYLGKPVRNSHRQKNGEVPSIVLDRVQQASALPHDDIALETVLRVLGARAPGFKHNWLVIERKLGMGWRPDLRWWWPWWSGPGVLTFVIQNQARLPLWPGRSGCSLAGDQAAGLWLSRRAEAKDPDRPQKGSAPPARRGAGTAGFAGLLTP